MFFTRGQAITFIEKVFGKGIESNGGLNLSVVCPRCAQLEDDLIKKHLAIRTDNFINHCWKCQFKSHDLSYLISIYHPNFIEEFTLKFQSKQSVKITQESLFEKNSFDLKLSNLLSGNKIDFKPKSIEIKKPLNLPLDFILIATNRDKGISSVDKAWKYLLSRNVSESDLWLWKFGISDYLPPSKKEINYRYRVIIPSFNVNGELNFFSARAYWNKLYPKYNNPEVNRENVIFNEININWKEELTIVEGVFDLIKCNENATCLLGSNLEKNHLLFQKIAQNQTPVLLALDSDVINKAYRLAKMLIEYNVRVRILRLPKRIKDVGELTKSQFFIEREKAKVLSREEILLRRLME